MPLHTHRPAPHTHFTNARIQKHDTFAALLTARLCAGLVLSYLSHVRSVHLWTQAAIYKACLGEWHYKIIREKSSEGLSPVFLLLGSTSSASGMLNVCVLRSRLQIRWTKLTGRPELRSSGLSSGVVGPSYVYLTSFSPCRTATDPVVAIGLRSVLRIGWRGYTSFASVAIFHNYVRTPTPALRPYSLTVVCLCAASSFT